MNRPAGAPGRVKEISSAANPIVKQIRLLEKKRHREETNSFLAEGMKLIIDAIDNGWRLKTLIHAASASDNEAVTKLAARAVALGADVIIVPERVLGQITRRDNPQMVAGVLERRFADPARIEAGNDDVWIALDRVRDPGNLGTIIRTADAGGASGVILVGETTDPFAAETVRATMGSIFAVPLARMDTDRFAGFAGRWSGQIVGTRLEGSVDFRVPDYAQGPILLLMGNEQAGLPGDLAALCTTLVRIPQAGRADSLNLAVATALCLYEARRHAFPIADGARS
ncbi:MAG: RNA methyltransferase [Roseitalea porphyridii]|jgi:TrmH family RNA methyltransferase|uniref:TrmH family RNA methyltransferase n=1 Tax=Roseitalea porphyridii TaxID=1852022 RepID=UPI0032EFF5F0